MFESSDLFTVGILIVLEGLLSADNAMVLQGITPEESPACSPIASERLASLRADYRPLNFRISRRSRLSGVWVRCIPARYTRSMRRIARSSSESGGVVSL